MTMQFQIKANERPPVSLFEDPARVEVLKNFFASAHPMPDRLQYLELKEQGLSKSAIKKLMGISSAQFANIHINVRYWNKRLEKDGKLVPLRRRSLGLPIEKDQAIAHFRISLKNKFQSIRLEKFLVSRGIECSPLKLRSGLFTAEILLTDDLALAERSRTSVILVSGCFEDISEIRSLIGCIALPFSFEVIAAQLKAILKRMIPQTKKADRILRLGEFELNQTCFRAYYQNRPVILTAMEFRVIERLVMAEGQVVSYEDIEIAAWGDNSFRPKSLLKAQICNIRRKGIPIRTSYGIGYAIGSAQ